MVSRNIFTRIDPEQEPETREEALMSLTFDMAQSDDDKNMYNFNLI